MSRIHRYSIIHKRFTVLKNSPGLHLFHFPSLQGPANMDCFTNVSPVFFQETGLGGESCPMVLAERPTEISRTLSLIVCNRQGCGCFFVFCFFIVYILHSYQSKTAGPKQQPPVPSFPNPQPSPWGQQPFLYLFLLRMTTSSPKQ